MDLPDILPPTIRSNAHDLLMDGRPHHDVTDLHAYMDSEWGTCPQTRRSFGGDCVRLASGPVDYKSRLQPTVAQSSTEAEFLEATDCGKLILFIRIILWDLGVPQCDVTIAYEDNDACTAMANAKKPTPCTRHIDIKHHVITEWVERDLMKLERINSTINLADHFTKQLGPLAFNRHIDYIMGHVPPQYSSCYQQLIGQLHKSKDITTKPLVTIVPIAPNTTPPAATAARFVTSWATILQHFTFVIFSLVHIIIRTSLF
mmetsp:Transcript_27572/g.58265  ORF Transcript_27572/g.58265 Transcript_27572/m.58265 type:complete len:259 (+) Transcript_27572:120-896(+)